MSALQITITDAGRAALINAQNTGTVSLIISQVGVSATHTAGSLTARTSLPGEIKRLSTFGGDVVADDTLHLTIRDESADVYSLRSFGLYLSNGTLFAIYSQAATILEKSAAALVLLATDIKLAALTTANIAFGDTSFINPPATEEVPGVVELADQAETSAGTRNDVAVTPKWLKALITPLLAGKSDTGHSHTAADIISGVLALARLPGLPASQTTSGTFDPARIPALAMTAITGLVSALAGKIDTTSTGINAKTISFGLGIAASATSGAGAGTYARLYSISGGLDDTAAAGFGALGSNTTPTYAFMGVGDRLSMYGSTSALRVYATYASWGTYPFWHSGNFTPANYALVGHAHSAADITSGTLALARIPTLPASQTTSGIFDVARIPDLPQSKITDLTTALAGKVATAPGSTFDVADASKAQFIVAAANGSILSGIHMPHASGLYGAQFGGRLTIFRGRTLENGAWSSWVDFWHSGNFTPANYALVGHAHSAADITSGTLALARIPTLPASQTTSGIFDVARIPDLAAAKISSGVFDPARIPALAMAAITGLVAALAGKSDTGHAHSAADITSGTLGLARIPTLPASQTTSGTFDPARIPALAMSAITGLVAALAGKSDTGHAHSAADITSGTLGLARIPTLPASQTTSGIFDVARIPDLTAAKITDLLDLVWPAGVTKMLAMASIPTGMRALIEDGSAVSRTTYARLFAAIGTTYGAGDGATTFNLPDSRAYFFRGLDNGRGLDPGRAMATNQADQNRAHQHSIPARSSTGSNNNYVEDGDADGNARSTFTGSEGGNEARPINQPRLFVITY